MSTQLKNFIKGLPPKVAFPRFCDDFREKIESLQIDICLSIGDLQTFDFFRKARERWGNGLLRAAPLRAASLSNLGGDPLHGAGEILGDVDPKGVVSRLMHLDGETLIEKAELLEPLCKFEG